MSSFAHLNDAEEKAKMLRGELYHAFVPSLVAERARCSAACHAFNTASGLTRLERADLWNSITNAPAFPADTPEAALEREPWVEAPIHIDYGVHVHCGENVFINFNCTIIDTCAVTIGARTLIGPNVSLYTGCHPLDPDVRRGTAGPEFGKEIRIGEDCWIGGGATVLPGVSVGRGSVVGAASVVTKDAPEYSVVAGNPARVVRRLRPVEENVAREDVRALLKRLEDLEAEVRDIKGQLMAASYR